jgi:MFS family permease
MYGAPLEWVGRRPTWHWAIHCMVYAGVARMELASVPSTKPLLCIGTYAACFVFAVFTGRLVQRFRADRAPRIVSTSLSVGSFIFGCLRAPTVGPHRPTHLLVVPLCAAGIAFALNVVGEALTTWFPAPERGTSQGLRSHGLRSQPRYVAAHA